MPIIASDIKTKLTIKTGSAGNSLAQSDVNQSLGKFISTTEVVDATLNNLFDNVSGAENAASTIDYRCIAIHNSHASLALITPKVYISAEVSGGASIAIGADPAGQSVIGQGSAQGAEIATETNAPAGVTFSAPTTEGAAVSLGATLDAGKCIFLWVRRTAANTAAKDNDGATLTVFGDTAE